MLEKESGVDHRGTTWLWRIGARLVLEVAVATAMLVALAAIEAYGHRVIDKLAVNAGWPWLGTVMGGVEWLVLVLDATGYLWVVLVSTWRFVKEVR